MHLDLVYLMICQYSVHALVLLGLEPTELCLWSGHPLLHNDLVQETLQVFLLFFIRTHKFLHLYQIRDHHRNDQDLGPLKRVDVCL